METGSSYRGVSAGTGRRGCIGNYDFEQIAYYARKRFVEGCDTVSLMAQAASECEKEEIALVSLLDVEDNTIRELQLTCQHAERCRIMDCREKLKKMIEEDLARLTSHGFTPLTGTSTALQDTRPGSTGDRAR